MPLDDRFARRVGKADTERPAPSREPAPRYLIVCEGTKTEPNYFTEIINSKRIPHTAVRVAKNDGVSPDRVVDHAIRLLEQERKFGDDFDGVFCVFDRDSHSTFDDACQRVLAHSVKGPLRAIASVPCFEYWLILHFGFTDQPFHRAGKKSVGDQVVAKLKKQPGFSKYSKGQTGIYATLAGQKTLDAIRNAAQGRRAAGARYFNPSTEIDELVEALLRWPMRPAP